MKLAVCFSKAKQNHRQITSQMVDAQKLCPHHIDQIESFHEKGSLGAIQTLKKVSPINLYHKASNGNILAVSGVPVDLERGLNHKLAEIAQGDYRQAARLLKTLDGAFVIIFWDNQNQKFIIATDFLGFQPMYMVKNEEYFILATQQNAIAASGQVKIEMEPAGWAAFIAFGAFIGDKTSVKNVSRLEPASIYTFDVQTFDLNHETYWQWPKQDNSITLENFDDQSLVDILKRNILAYMEYERCGTVLLSGGNDSRLIAALLTRLKLNPDALIVKHPDEHFNADGRLAKRLARRLGLNFTERSPREDFFSSVAYLDYCVRSEVMTPSLYLFISNVSAFITEDLDAFWEGVTLGLIMNCSHAGLGRKQQYIQENIKGLDSHRWKAAQEVFAPPFWEAMYPALREALDKELIKYDDDSTGVHGFVVRNWTRNRTAPNPIQVYYNYSLPFALGTCRPFMELLASVPYEVKQKGQLNREIFLRQFKDICDIPSCSGGKLMLLSSGFHRRAALKMTKISYRLLNHVMKPLGLSFRWQPSKLVDQVIERVDINHPDLNTEKVKTVRKLPYHAYAKMLLYYWQLWRWIMEGKINQLKDELFTVQD